MKNLAVSKLSSIFATRKEKDAPLARNWKRYSLLNCRQLALIGSSPIRCTKRKKIFKVNF